MNNNEYSVEKLLFSKLKVGQNKIKCKYFEEFKYKNKIHLNNLWNIIKYYGLDYSSVDKYPSFEQFSMWCFNNSEDYKVYKFNERI